MHGFFTGPLHDLRQSLGLADAVEFPGWIPRSDLHDLYARAWAFLYPTLFEGFGLPVLEALAAGVPTACSNIEPVAGIAGDAALQFDPARTERNRRRHGTAGGRRTAAPAPGGSGPAAGGAVFVEGDGGKDAGGPGRSGGLTRAT